MLAIAGLLTIGLAVAFFAGRGSEAAPSVTSRQGNLRVHAHTLDGAVDAYLDQQAQLADSRLWAASPERRAQILVKLIAAPGLRASLERSIGAAVRGHDPLARALQANRPVLARSAPLGYRVVSYSPRRAVLDVWTFSLLGGVGIPLDLRLARYQVSELWADGTWRLAKTQLAGEGVPVRFAGAPGLSARLTRSLASFRTVRHEP